MHEMHPTLKENSLIAQYKAVKDA